MDERYKHLHAHEPFVNDPDISFASPVLDILDPGQVGFVLRLIERGLLAKTGVNTIRILTHEDCGGYKLRDGQPPSLDLLRSDLEAACSVVYWHFKGWGRFAAGASELEVKGNIVKNDGSTVDWYISPSEVKLPALV
jgi:hypothetical protein